MAPTRLVRGHNSALLPGQGVWLWVGRQAPAKRRCEVSRRGGKYPVHSREVGRGVGNAERSACISRYHITLAKKWQATLCDLFIPAPQSPPWTPSR